MNSKILANVLGKLRKEDKFSLAYILDAINYKGRKNFVAFGDSYKKKELLDMLMEAVSDDYYLQRLLKLNSYKDCKEE